MTTATVQSADGDLLRLYAREKNQDAFTRIVRRHVDWVYSAALRITRDAGLAEDVAQGVFLALAQKSDRLANHPSIAGWLFQATQFGARAALKRERRRRHIEAQAMHTLKQTIVQIGGTHARAGGITEEWIDPDHDDRAVAFSYTLQDADTGAILNRWVTEFGDYATLPPPDGRSYPTSWTHTDFNLNSDGKLVPSGQQSKTTIHFFPGKTLPALPAKNMP